MFVFRLSALNFIPKPHKFLVSQLEHICVQSLKPKVLHMAINNNVYADDMEEDFDLRLQIIRDEDYLNCGWY